MSITGSTNANTFKLIKDQYGAPILANIRRLERLRIKYGRYSNHLRFSLRCHHSDLLPNDLQLKCKVHTQKARDVLNKASKTLLQERIRLNHNKRNFLKQEIDKVDTKLKETIEQKLYDDVKTIHTFTQKKEMELSKVRQVKKYDRLKARKEKEDGLTDQNKVVDRNRWVLNLSDKQLNDSEISLLSKGMKFAMTQKEVPKEEIITKVESSLSKFDKPEAATIRAKVSLALQQAKAPKDNLTQRERKALLNLKKDKDIVILPADKGRATVIMNKTDYYRKCDEHIENGPYELVKRDPTYTIKRGM